MGARKGEQCARKAGHPGKHLSADAVAAKRARARKHAKEWARNNPEKKREYARNWMRAHYAETYPKSREWAAANLQHLQTYKREWKFGLSAEQQDQLMEIQDGLCGVCRVDLSSLRTKQVVLDHDHGCCPPESPGRQRKTCGKCVRGFLCRSCNQRVGLVERGKAVPGKGPWTAAVLDSIKDYVGSPPALRLVSHAVDG